MGSNGVCTGEPTSISEAVARLEAGEQGSVRARCERVAWKKVAEHQLEPKVLDFAVANDEVDFLADLSTGSPWLGA